MANAYHSKAKYAQIAAKLRGQKRTPETRKKMSLALMGHSVSEKTRAKFRARKYSKETRAKISKSRLGKTSWNKGIPMSEEQKERLRIANIGRKTSLKTRRKLREAMLKYFQFQNPAYIPTPYDVGENRRRHEEIRRNRLRSNGGNHTEKQWIFLKGAYDFKCLMCHRIEPKIKLTKDHIIPIRNGGTDDISNIQPLCRSCNSKKR